MLDGATPSDGFCVEPGSLWVPVSGVCKFVGLSRFDGATFLGRSSVAPGGLRVPVFIIREPSVSDGSIALPGFEVESCLSPFGTLFSFGAGVVGCCIAFGLGL